MKEQIIEDLFPIICILSGVILIILGHGYAAGWLIFIAMITKS